MRAANLLFHECVQSQLSMGFELTLQQLLCQTQYDVTTPWLEFHRNQVLYINRNLFSEHRIDQNIKMNSFR